LQILKAEFLAMQSSMQLASERIRHILIVTFALCMLNSVIHIFQASLIAILAPYPSNFNPRLSGVAGMGWMSAFADCP
jgi:hypothetical protein